jgi:hypothetical protein
MYRTNNKQVAIAWLNSQDAQSHNGNYKTYGGNLYSYRMLIGVTAPNGQKYLLNVRGKGKSYSSTTSQHVSKAAWQHNCIEPIIVEPIVRNGWRYFPTDLIPGYTLSEYGTFHEITV